MRFCGGLDAGLVAGLGAALASPGAKIINPTRQGTVRKRILDIFTPGEAKAAPKPAAKPLPKPPQKRAKGEAEAD